MVRVLIWVLLLGFTGLIAAPMILASLYLDQRGVELNGRVYSKSEYVRLMRTRAWSRTSTVTFEYTLPETGGASFFDVAMEPEKYDSYHNGQPVKLRYLRREDIPKLPGADAMWQMRMLPYVRLTGQRAFDGLRALITPKLELGFATLAAIVTLLWVWRRLLLPGFAWAMGGLIACGIVAMMFYDFPQTTPPPTREVRAASGKVRSIQRIDWLLSTNRTHGMPAHQPLDIIGVAFVPQGFRDPVLAVDLVDRGSIPRLAEGAPVEVDYEAVTPRTAWMRNATRTFPRRNLIGLGEDAALWIGVLIAGLMLWQFLGKAFKRL